LRSLHSLHKSWGPGGQGQSMGPGALLQCPPTRAACARPGPGATAFPDGPARMRPSDSLPPSATAPVPLARGVPRGRRWFCAPRRADNTGARTRVVRRRRGTGAPRPRDGSRGGEGLPGYGTVLFICAMVDHPAGDTPILARTTPLQRGGCLQGNRVPRPPGSLEVSGPQAPWPTWSQTAASPTPLLGSSQG
jgi:hypothetical protein